MRELHPLNEQLIDIIVKQAITAEERTAKVKKVVFEIQGEGKKQKSDQAGEIAADINAQTQSGDTALTWAAAKGQLDTVKILLEAEADPNIANKRGFTALYYAARDGQKEMLQLLLARKSNPKAAIDDGSTPLHIASQHGHKEIVKLLLEEKVDIDSQNKEGNSPLILAAYNKHIDTVKILLENKANPNISNKKGETPFYWAFTSNCPKMGESLAKAGADPTLCTIPEYLSALLLEASKDGRVDIVKPLLDKKVEVNAQNREDNTALIFAAHNGHIDVVKLLLAGGADPKLVNKKGESAFSRAAAGGHTKITQLLSQTTPSHSLVMPSVLGLLGLGGMLTTGFMAKDRLAEKFFYPTLATEFLLTCFIIFVAYKCSSSKKTSPQQVENPCDSASFPSVK